MSSDQEVAQPSLSPVSELIQIITEAVDLVAYLAEDSASCLYDHDGACQEHHGGFRYIERDGEWVYECWYVAAKRFITKARDVIK